MVPLATGSDAGGSIRIPGCYSGCFGIKPTYGRIPLVPMLPTYMSRFWTLGPLSRTVTDAALYLDCAGGYHSDDPDSLPAPGYSYVEILRNIPPGLRIGFSPTLGYATVQPEVLELVESAVSVFQELGHRVDLWEGSLPDVSQAWSELVACDIYAHVRNNLETIRPDLGRTLVGALDHAKTLSLDDQIRNHTLRIQLDRDLSKFFDRYDLLLSPTLPTEAFAAKGPPPTVINGHLVPLLHAVAFTYPFNVSGHPAATVRAGFTPAGLPAGLQIVGERHREDLVLQAAYAFEEATPWLDRWPDL
jgi:aspartyl-tRNA(Asn)/glutamyl-tRNA(Gln) amidotransferase subunit A